MSENSTAEDMNREPIPRESDAWQVAAEFFRRPAVLLPTLTLVTAVLYSGTLFFEFVWDDKAQIVDNPLIRSLGQLHKVFISDLWYHTGRFQLYYRPLFVIWSMLNYAVLGLRPWGWHLTAVLVHIAAVSAMFWMVRKLGMEYWTAALAALIFAVHPIHIECVAWISAVSDSMATAFAALSFVGFLHVRNQQDKHRVLWQVVSCMFLACALLTKEIALGFTVLVAVYVWIFPTAEGTTLSQRLRAAVVASFPYAAITVAYVLLRKYALAQVTGKFDPMHTQSDVLLTLPYVLIFYLRQLLLPAGLTGLYYFPYVTVQHLAKFVVPLLLLLGLLGLLLFWARRKNDPLVLFAAIWMLIGLAPALYLRAFTEGDFVRDRYVYLGSIGFAILVAKAIRMIPAVKGWGAGTVQGTAIVTLCTLYVGMSLAQQAYWDSDLLIYSRGYQLYPENPYTEVGLAREYSRLGAYDRAIPLVEDAFRRRRDYLYGAYALADVYIDAGHYEQGRVALQYAQDLMPQYAKSDTGAAAVAAMWGKLGDYDQALALCSQVLARDPDLFSAVYNCGNIQMKGGNYDTAERLLRHAIQLSPELAAPRHFLGRTLFLDGRNNEARPLLQQAVAIDPGIYDYHYWLGRSFEQTQDKVDARREYFEALRLNEDSEETKQRLISLEQR